MSDTGHTSQNKRNNFLIQFARLLTALSIFGLLFFGYWGIVTTNWPYFLLAGAFGSTCLVAFSIARSRGQDRPAVGVWHLLSVIALTVLLLSAIRPNPGSGLQAAILIIISTIVILSVPQNQIMQGVSLGVFASLASGLLSFYSPFQQIADPILDPIISWFARIAIIGFLGIAFVQFRRLSLTSKFLISFLGVVVAISLAFNIVMTTTTTNALTDRIGQQLHSVAESRGLVIGDYINGQAEILQTLALDETIRQSVRAANALKPTLENIQDLDRQWRQGVESDNNNSLINSRLSNSLSSDLRAFQALAPEHVEVFVTDRAGALVSATNVTSDYYQADEDWWASTYQEGSGDIYISQPEYDESANALSILIAVPIYDTRQGDLIGVLRTTISIDSLVSVLREPIGETGEVDIFFPDETMLDTREGVYEDINPDSMIAIQNTANRIYFKALFEGEDSILSQGPVQSQVGTAKVNELNWKVFASQDTEEALAPVRQQVRLVSFFATVMAGVAALLSLLVAQRLAQPIINLTDAANKVASGNLNTRASVESQDETGQLAEAFNAMTAQLQEMLLGLEERVTERTSELEESSQQLEKRAVQFETIAQLARTINTIQDPESLLQKITQLVSVSFGFYHVGLFLLDESRQYAVLNAANSEGGQRMLARKHRLGVGQTGIVGYVTSTGNPRIALDTGADAAYFDNPDLPDTRSEMALPLRVGRTIVGALDVQSTEQNAFTEDDVEVLSILADVVSVAIENARLFEESKRVLAEAQSAFSESTLEAWRQITTRRKAVGYTFSGTSIRPLEKPMRSTEIREAIKTGKISVASVDKDKKSAALAVPIKLREQIIGTLNINLPEAREWDSDEINIAQALAERIGVAIENATLLEESRRRAARESTIGDISTKINASTEIEHIMRAAVGELRQALGASEVSLRLSNEGTSSDKF